MSLASLPREWEEKDDCSADRARVRRHGRQLCGARVSQRSENAAHKLKVVRRPELLTRNAQRADLIRECRAD